MRWDDPLLGVSWPGPVAVLAPRDRDYPDLDESELGALPRARVVSAAEAEGGAGETLVTAPERPTLEPTAAGALAAPEEPTAVPGAVGAPEEPTAAPMRREPAPIVDPGAAAEAVRIALARRDPLWRCQAALAEACRKAGIATAPLPDDASRGQIQAWIDRHRGALRERAA